jgi:hypothetical protein
MLWRWWNHEIALTFWQNVLVIVGSMRDYRINLDMAVPCSPCCFLEMVSQWGTMEDDKLRWNLVGRQC